MANVKVYNFNGDAFRRLFKEGGYSNKGLARLAKQSPSIISRMKYYGTLRCRGKIFLTNTVQNVADAMNVPIAELLQDKPTAQRRIAIKVDKPNQSAVDKIVHDVLQKDRLNADLLKRAISILTIVKEQGNLLTWQPEIKMTTAMYNDIDVAEDLLSKFKIEIQKYEGGQR